MAYSKGSMFVDRVTGLRHKPGSEAVAAQYEKRPDRYSHAEEPPVEEKPGVKAAGRSGGKPAGEKTGNGAESGTGGRENP